ncbi:MAG: hypothetical protein V3V20_09670 [Algisphaera sp.]
MSNAVLTKKQRKQLRKQMQERKQALLAKHGRDRQGSVGGAGGSVSGGLPPRQFKGGAKPNLPGRLPRGTATLPAASRWQAPKPAREMVASVPPVRSRRVASPVASASEAPAAVPKSILPTPTPVGTRPRTVWQSAQAEPEVCDLDAPGPGPLARAAVGVEALGRKAAAAYRDRPWQDQPIKKRSEAYRTLAVVVTPLRVLGVAAVFGALALAREARGLGVSDMGTLVVLGMGLGGAVMMLAMAEMARALQAIVRR